MPGCMGDSSERPYPVNPRECRRARREQPGSELENGGRSERRFPTNGHVRQPPMLRGGWTDDAATLLELPGTIDKERGAYVVSKTDGEVISDA